MLLELDAGSETPLYVQLRNQIVLGIGSGAFALGERLPTVRQLAQDARVNVMTVSKAYQILKREGYIEVDRRHGARVSPSAACSDEFRERVEAELALLVTESSLCGLKKEDFLALCERAYNGLRIRQEGVTA